MIQTTLTLKEGDQHTVTNPLKINYEQRYINIDPTPIEVDMKESEELFLTS